jgi:DNA-binding transcriptional regulator LsrR (DeoR family)
MAETRCIMVGLGGIAWQAPLHASGCISDAELTELIEAGAVGEIAGRAFDAYGDYICGSVNDRVTGLAVLPDPARVALGVGAGAGKVAAFCGALAGGLLNAIITDEQTAAAVLGDN